MSYRRLFCLVVGITLMVFLGGCKEDDDPASPSNSPPDLPSRPVPANNATAQNNTVDLSWFCSDPDDDPLTYDVYFGTSSTPPLVNSGQHARTYDLGTLARSQNYYWKIVAHDDHGHTRPGELWYFGTGF